MLTRRNAILGLLTTPAIIKTPDLLMKVKPYIYVRQKLFVLNYSTSEAMIVFEHYGDYESIVFEPPSWTPGDYGQALNRAQRENSIISNYFEV